MVGATWPTSRQLAFFDARLPDFKKAQAERSLQRIFWPGIESDFFSIWLTQDVEKAEREEEAREKEKQERLKEAQEPKQKEKAKRKKRNGAGKTRTEPIYATHEQWHNERVKQIQNWFYNHTSESRKTKAPLNITVNAGGIAGPIRGLTEEQVYSKMYYTSRIKDHVDAEINGSHIDKRTKIAVRARVTREMYQAETEEVKAQVRAQKEADERKRQEAADACKNVAKPENVSEFKPTDYERYQEVAPALVRQFLESLGAKTGYAWTIIGGGPSSAEENGGFQYISYHVPAEPNGMEFDEWYKDFNEGFVTSFSEYCHSVFPEMVRLQRAITITEEARGREALELSGRGVGRLIYTDRAAIDKNQDIGGQTNLPEVVEPVVREEGGDKLEKTRADSEGAPFTDIGEMAATTAHGLYIPAGAGVEEPELTRLMREEPKPVQPILVDMDMLDRTAVDWDKPLEGGDKPFLACMQALGDGSTELAGLWTGSGNRDGEVGAILLPPPPQYDNEEVHNEDLLPANTNEKGALKSRKRKTVEVPEPEMHGGREKRSRRVQIHREVADWLVRANTYLCMGIDDNKWGMVVDRWFEFEKIALDTGSRLTEMGLRPAEISKWVGSRRWDADPAIEDVRDFATRWLIWWKAMQPACRKGDGDDDLPLAVESHMKREMTALRKAGQNGLVVLLVGLKWWALLRTSNERWYRVVNDVAMCLDMFQS